MSFDLSLFVKTISLSVNIIAPSNEIPSFFNSQIYDKTKLKWMNLDFELNMLNQIDQHVKDVIQP